MRRMAGLLVSGLVLAGCGTQVSTSQVAVRVQDPAGVIAEPVQVALFDPQQGDTQDWAEQSLGTTSAAQPYTKTVTSTESKMGYESHLAKNVRAGLYLPGYTAEGYFLLDFAPKEGQSRVSAPFVTWWDGNQEPVPGPLQATVTSTAKPDGWAIEVTVGIERGAGT